LANLSSLLHCALASCGAVYCNQSCLWVCDSGRAVSEPYYSQRARSVCVSLSAFFIILHLTTFTPSTPHERAKCENYDL